MLEGKLKASTVAPKGGGWDLAVERGHKLSLAESQLTKLKSRMRLMEQQYQRAMGAVAAWGKHQPAVEQAEAEVLACLAEIDQPWGTASPPIVAETEGCRPRRSLSKSPTARATPLAIGGGGCGDGVGVEAPLAERLATVQAALSSVENSEEKKCTAVTELERQLAKKTALLQIRAAELRIDQDIASQRAEAEQALHGSERRNAQTSNGGPTNSSGRKKRRRRRRRQRGWLGSRPPQHRQPLQTLRQNCWLRRP
jgi:hypothetical protein